MSVGMRQELALRLARGCDIAGHLEFLSDCVADRGGRLGDERGRICRVAELGVRAGNSTCAFLAALEVTRGGLWSVDIRLPQVPGDWRARPEWRFLQADSVSPEARAFIPGMLDVLFIDTSHDLDHTLAELAAYAPRVRAGGIICCHDTQWHPDGDRDSGTPDGPVAQALDIWCAAQPGMRWHNRPTSYGLGVIRV